MNSKERKKIFILGCERSGSTWLGNIFDSHPNVEFFMEPFADYAQLFYKFPERNVYINKASNDLVNLVEEGYRCLYNLKYSLFYKPNRSLYLKAFDHFFFNQYQKMVRLFRLRLLQIKIDQYNLLNLNTSKIPINKQSKKQFDQPIEVIKELRLNFKVELLSQVFPDSRYIISIRHPGAQISSIMNLFQKGGLGELKRAIASFIGYIKSSDRFEKYCNLIDKYDCEDIETKLIFWWLINYEVLIEDLEKKNVLYKIVYHEEISEDPLKISEQVFNFCGLNLETVVINYIKLSSMFIGRKRHFDSLDTNRDSANYYRSAIQNIDISLSNKIYTILCDLDKNNKIESHVRRYLSRWGKL